ncbi:hypothetical protein [Actinokineospora diospyrosa]|uniref:Uncharacterized protein n=1 Tax=Actinokineospora diospyrosa TaxID=103728 RepID=A0ABT1IK00_9PSEU|nr:hypothetical protein [Actinokineospora diospyrosa]MCP2272536.1 hypothetical protein [Actinokineospora diospyrosa]
MTPAPPKGKTAPVVFSHPTTEDRGVTKNPGSAPMPRFESSSDSPRVPDWSNP